MGAVSALKTLYTLLCFAISRVKKIGEFSLEPSFFSSGRFATCLLMNKFYKQKLKRMFLGICCIAT